MRKLALPTTLLFLAMSLSSCCMFHHRGPHGPGHQGPCAVKNPCEMKADCPCEKPCKLEAGMPCQKPCNN